MATPSRPDPVRETFIDILKQLNQAETRHEGNAVEQALELAELEARIKNQRSVRPSGANVASALGLLVRNGLVKAVGASEYSWQRQRLSRPRYQITGEGKKFLVEALENVNRVR
jgi:DNA-binding PadR family transcriptional regulator